MHTKQPKQTRSQSTRIFTVFGFLVGGLLTLIAAGSFLFFNSREAFAITIDRTIGATFNLGSASPVSIIISIINWALGLLALVAIIVCLYAGFLWLTSGGNERRLEKAKKILIEGLIGLLIILAAWGIVLYVFRTVQDFTSGGASCIADFPAGCTADQPFCCAGSCQANACGGGFPGGGDQTFYVKATIPRSNARAALCTIIGAQFNKPIDRGSVTNSTFYAEVLGDLEGNDATGRNGDACTTDIQCKSGTCTAGACEGNTIPGTIHFDGDPAIPDDSTWAVIYPRDKELPAFARFQVTALGGIGGVKAFDGDKLSSTYTWEFYTNNDTDNVAPTVVEKRCTGSTEPGVNNKDCTYNTSVCDPGGGRCTTEVSDSPYPADGDGTNPGDDGVCRATPIGADFNEIMNPISYNDRLSVILSPLNPATTPVPDFEASAISLRIRPQTENFTARPDEIPMLDANTDYYVRLFGGRARCVGGLDDGVEGCTKDDDCADNGPDDPGICNLAYGALQDACLNPLDGNGNGRVNGADEGGNPITDEASPKDDFMSAERAETPWNFKTGTQEICSPEITNIVPGSAFDALDDSLAPGPDEFDTGGAGDPGWITLIGDYLAPNPTITFNGNIEVEEGNIQCFNREEKVDGGVDPGEGLCMISNGIRNIQVKIPPDAKVEGPVTVTVAGENGQSTVTFNPLSPHIFSVTASGRPGDFITLHGQKFCGGNPCQPGIVWFRRRLDNSIFRGEQPPAELCGGDFWTDDEITIVIPNIPNPVTDEIFDIQVETTGVDGKRDTPADGDTNPGPGDSNEDRDNKIGNHKIFTITDVERPSICRIEPSCSNTPDETVTFYGKGLHNDRNAWSGKAFLRNGETENEANTYTTWQDDRATVQFGGIEFKRYETFVQITDPDGIDRESNTKRFNAPCGNIPYVVNDASCNPDEDRFPSTNPRPGQTEVCLDIGIAGRFSIKMNNETIPANPAYASSIRNTNNIKLFRCDADQTCTNIRVPIAIPPIEEDPTYIGDPQYDKASFRFFPGTLAQNTWYELFISKDVQSDPNTCFTSDGRILNVPGSCPTNPAACETAGGLCGGVNMRADFAAHFQTKNDPGTCPVKNVSVHSTAPNQPVIHNAHPQTENYESIPIGPNCTLINPTLYNGQYQWQALDPAGKDVADMTGALDQYQATARTVGDTVDNEGTARIQSTLEGQDDDAPFRVNFAFCTADTDCEACGPGTSSCVNGTCTPYITTLSPIQGPISQSVTITGCYFGSTNESAEDVVKFRDTTNGNELISEMVCGGASWRNSRIITRVPEGLTRDALSEIWVNNRLHGTPTDLASNKKEFPITNLCVDENNNPIALAGPDGIPLFCDLAPFDRNTYTTTLSGDNFGATRNIPAKDYVVFTKQQDPQQWEQAINYPQWIQTSVEAQANPVSISGPVKITNDSCASNAIDLVITCDDHNDCGAPGCCRNNICISNAACPGDPGGACVNNVDCISNCCNAGSCTSIEDAPTFCPNPGGAGTQCIDENFPACQEAQFSNCSAGYQCRSGDDDPPPGVDNCRCCCNPDIAERDSWLPGLTCVPNLETCTGGTRGLYCGCTNDAQCGDFITNGCGVVAGQAQLCCVARPIVESSLPTDGSYVCKNAVLEFTFSREMNPASITFANDNFQLLKEGVGSRIYNPSDGSHVSPVSEHLNAIDSFAENLIIAVGGNGTILKYDGANWQTEVSPTTEELNDVFVLDATQAWAVGDNGTILKLAGGVWSKENSGVTTHLRGAAATAPNNVWAVGDNGTMLRFTGVIWQNENPQGTITAEHLNDVTAIPDNIWMIGNKGTIVRFKTGEGYSKEFEGGTPENLKAIHALATAPVLYAVGNNGMVLFNDQQPNGWQIIPPDPAFQSTNLTGVQILPTTRRTWISGDNGVIAMYLGGPWTLSSTTDIFFKDIVATDTGFIRAVGNTYENISNIGQLRVYHTGSERDRKTVAQFIPTTEALPGNTALKAVWKGDDILTDNVPNGVVSKNNIGMNGPDLNASGFHNKNFEFTTTDSFCELANLKLTPYIPQDPIAFDPLHPPADSHDTFFERNQTGVVFAQGKSREGFTIAPIPGYSWRWDWEVTPAGQTIINAEASTTNVLPINTNGLNQNGEVEVFAYARPTNDGYASDPPKFGSLPIYVFYCQNPWAFSDIDGNGDDAGSLTPLHQIIRYCKDEYSAESTFNNTLVKSTGLPQGVYREYLFTQGGGTHDGIGVRVFANPERLNPAQWYKEHAPNPVANYSIISGGVNGYEAVQVGRTVYIAGTNQYDAADNGGLKNLFSNIYIISYSEGANNETQKIFREMIANWSFNTNVNVDLKDELVRDTKRVTELGAMAALLRDSYVQNRRYPDLKAGTFLRYQTTSKWNSWAETLGPSLSFIPIDPINSFDDPQTNCPATQGFDAEAETCWKPDAQAYVCPSIGNSAGIPSGKSRVYQYKVTPNGQAAWVFANLEYRYDDVSWVRYDNDGDGGLESDNPAMNPCDGVPGSSCNCFNYGLRNDVDADQAPQTTIIHNTLQMNP